jgi:hypothetical protein
MDTLRRIFLSLVFAGAVAAILTAVALWPVLTTLYLVSVSVLVLAFFRPATR